MSRRITRREFLRSSAAAMGALAAGSLAGGCVVPTTAPPTEAPEAAAVPEGPKVWLGNSIRSLSNPYHAAWNVGGELFAEDMGLSDSYQVLLSEGDNTKQLDDIKALIAKAGKDVVFNVDPNEASNAVPIAEICEEAGVYFITQWNKPEDLHPWDFQYYVCHMAADDFSMGNECALAMFEALGGEGKVAHIHGMMGNTAAQGRFAGFQAALDEYPNIEFLEMQSADWDQTKAQNVVETWLAKYPDINGIHCGGDMHALGAAAAIKAAQPDRLGEILITGCAGDEPTTQAIIDGEVFATSGIDAKWQGGMGLSIPYHAYLGTFDPSQEPEEHREFYFGTTLVTKENAQKWMDEMVLGAPTYDWADLWGNVLKQIEYS